MSLNMGRTRSFRRSKAYKDKVYRRCSCMLCMNPRRDKNRGVKEQLTLNELRQLEIFKEAGIEEPNDPHGYHTAGNSTHRI